ncbi:MAG: IclR family transcriptional regulator [Candidatus Limnocylindrales bacterium]
MANAPSAIPRDVDDVVGLDLGDGADRTLNGAQVVDRVLDILEAFEWLGPQLGVSELSRALNLKKATTHRLLASLRRRDIVAQDPVTRRYQLGMRLWQLGMLALNQVDWIDRARPYLRQLRDETGETTHLAILDEGQVLYIDKVESEHSLRMPSQVGRRLPAHCTGVGKALLAYLTAAALADVIERHGLPSFTPATIIERHILVAELASIRERGYAVDDEEIEPGLRCIAAPIRGHSGDVVAAISIAGPSSRVRREEVDRYADRVVAAARQASAALGAPSVRGNSQGRVAGAAG